jgi:phage-related baseplate assembly protein
MIQAKLTGFETAETTLTLKMSRENWHEYVSEKVSLGDDCTISFGLPVDALTGITEHEKLESAIVEIMRLREILGMQHLRKDKRMAAMPNEKS